MDTTTAPPRGGAPRWLLEPNPFYPLSAICMMLGCYLLSGALELTAGGVGRLLVLIGVLNLYEFLLIGLGLYLIARRGLVMDGRLLLVLEVFFLVDAAHLNAEAFAADPVIGGAANLLVFLLALVKVGVIARVLRVEWSALHWVMLAVGFAFLIGLPGLLALRSLEAEVTAWLIYAAWWAVGLLIAAHGLWAGRPRDVFSPWPGVEGVLKPVLIGGVYVSLAAHLIAQGWVYRVDFAACFLAPVLLGLSVCWDRLAWGNADPARRGIGPFVLLAAAVAVSLWPPSELVGPVSALGGLVVSPYRLALIGGAAVCAVHIYRGRWVLFLVVGVLCLVAAGMGHSVASIVVTLRWVMEQSMEKGQRLFPRTALGWGVLSMAAAFLLLACGALVSVFKGKWDDR